MNRKKSATGIALITGLLFAVFILVLGLLFLTFINRDVIFASQQKAQMDAYFLAYSGLKYYGITGKPDSDSATSPENPITMCFPNKDCTGSQEEIRLLRDFDGSITGKPPETVIITGTVYTFWGTVRAKRTIVVPGGVYDNWYEQ